MLEPKLDRAEVAAETAVPQAAPSEVATAPAAPAQPAEQPSEATAQQPEAPAAEPMTPTPETPKVPEPTVTAANEPASAPAAAPDQATETPSGNDISKLIDQNTFPQENKAASPPVNLPAARPNPELVNEDQFAEIRNFVSIEARRIGDTVRVVFPFLDPVSSAVFRRGWSSIPKFPSIWVLRAPR
ncbi:hypothetical protein [Breoghania sp.]|uniref:hypothetical protein n=1 Tax=Breoghania sp. TaxID=2065378 RepID=UPI002615B44E|nr:hypothetical protein [Breoghania sp.]MDJ0932090.1 hypothetical protein [Breoghania sp.]